MGLSRKIFLPIFILNFLLITIFGISFGFLYVQRESLSKKLAEGEFINSLVHELGSLQRMLEIAVLSYRFEQQPVSVATIDNLEKRIGELMDNIESRSTNATAIELIRRAIDVRSNFPTINTELLFAIQRGNSRDIEKKFAKWSAGVQIIDSTISDLMSYNLATVERSAAELNAFLDKFLTMLAIVSTGAIFMSIVMTLYFHNIITLPIMSLSRAADKIAEKEFDINIDIASNDEIGRLSRIFKEMAARVKTYYDHLESEIRKKDEFIGIASHELKTPLTSLKIYIQVLQELARKNGHAEYNQHFLKINDQSDKLNNLVSNLLDIARIEGGKISYHKEKFDLNYLIASAVEETQAANPDHQIVVNGHIGMPVFGDKERIGQVVTNLLSNAVKYSPGKDKVIVSLSATAHEARVEVRDFGLGIEKKYHDKLFERFFRVHDHGRITFPGMGVGLYISSQIIRQHGGIIHVESEPGKGSVFSFTLPFSI